MVHELHISEVRQTFTSSNGTFNGSGAEGNFSGRLHKVVFKSTSWANGSIAITDNDGQSFMFFSLSGTNATAFYPRVYAHNGTTALSGTNWSEVEMPLFQGPLLFSGIGLGSAAGGTSGRIDVYFCPM